MILLVPRCGDQYLICSSREITSLLPNLYLLKIVTHTTFVHLPSLYQILLPAPSRKTSIVF